MLSEEKLQELDAHIALLEMQPSSRETYRTLADYYIIRQFCCGESAEPDDKEEESGSESFTRSANNESFDKGKAEKWVSQMQNADGTSGGHWTLSQIEQLIGQRGIDVDPVKMWVAMNAEYSDRCVVNKRYGVNNIDYYIDTAKAFWLDDKDSNKNKLSRYYDHVVKKGNSNRGQ